MVKRIVKIAAVSLASLIGAVVLAVVVYVIYVAAQYYRIEDNTEVQAEGNRAETLSLDGSYTLATYNVGFGAYSHDFSFFMDAGEMLDGAKTHGTGSKAKDRQTVLDNTNGALGMIADLSADFCFFQEVDTSSTRSRGVNQYEMLREGLGSGYSYSFAANFHSAFLFYPIFDPHGTVNAGVVTASRYRVESAVRRSFPIDESFPQKYLDLDRCFLISRLPIEGTAQQLVLINQHMSAYDEGGKIRAKQLELLNGVMAEEREKGNYVVVGGDFNHVLTEGDALFATEQKVPDWVAHLKPEDIAEGFSVVCAENAPTCRSTDMPYRKGVNYTAVLDGFLISDNFPSGGVTVENIDTDFLYSDHNPVKLTFRFR